MSAGMQDQKRTLKPFLSPMNAWAFSLGTSIGWGSLVITCSTYLSQAGPEGSVLGMLLGTAIMLVISRNFFYLIDCYPDCGGVYAYARDVFGYDHGFLAAWFLMLTYLAVFWANVTSLPLFSRYFVGQVFEVGHIYTLFGYKVYLGEALLSVAAILITAAFMSRRRRLTVALMTGLVCLFFVCILVCTVVAIVRTEHSFEPAYIPDKSVLSQIVRIACISPWAFIGFENVSHLSEEFSFQKSRSFRVLLVSVLTTALLYIAVMLLSVTAYPPEYSSWLEYIRDLGNLEGIKGLPAFYAADYYLGSAGIPILMLALLALIITSLIGNTFALSRLFFALSRDEILPARFAELNEDCSPGNAIWLVALVSLPVPFLGRTAIGWIVDVTTIGATLVYGFAAAAAFRMAGRLGDKKDRLFGLIGLVLMISFCAYLLIPNLFTSGTIEMETLFLFVVWAILGFIFFHSLLKKDQTRRFGQSIVVWIGLLALVLFTSLVWMGQSTRLAAGQAMDSVREYYSGMMPGLNLAEDPFIAGQMRALQRSTSRSVVTVMLFFSIALGYLISNYAIISRRARESEEELGLVRDRANTDPLTGVKSKHAYAERESAVSHEVKEGQAEEFSVVVCDVNGLKHVNDTLGHKAGDEYIRAASRLICELYKHSPVYRVGGDEFVVILTGRDYEHREQILKELNVQVEANIEKGAVVVSVGMSDYRPGEDQDFHTVFERADGLMYQRKQQLKAMGARTR